MPYLCHESTIGTDRMEETGTTERSPPESRSCGRPHSNSVQRSRKPICERCWTSGSRCKWTCALWVNSYDKDFTLRGKEWVRQGSFRTLWRHGDGRLQAPYIECVAKLF